MKRTDSNNNMQDLELIPGIKDSVVLKNVGKMVDTIFASSVSDKKMKELSKKSLEPCQTGAPTKQDLQKKYDAVIKNMTEQYTSFLSQKKLPYSDPLFLHANGQGWELCEILFNAMHAAWEQEYEKQTSDLTKVKELINKPTDKRNEKFQNRLLTKKQQLEQQLKQFPNNLYQMTNIDSQDFITAKNKQLSNHERLKKFEDLISQSTVDGLLNKERKKQNIELNITTKDLYLLANIASNFYDDIKSIFDISRREFYACFYSWVETMHDKIIDDFQWVDNQDLNAFFDNTTIEFTIDADDIEKKQMERLKYIGKILLVVNSIAIHRDEIDEQRNALKERLKQLHEEEVEAEEEKRDTVQGAGKKKKKKKKTKTNNISTINNISTVKLDEDKKEENLNIINNPDGWKYEEEISIHKETKQTKDNKSKEVHSLSKNKQKKKDFHLYSTTRKQEIINNIRRLPKSKEIHISHSKKTLEKVEALSREKGDKFNTTNSIRELRGRIKNYLNLNENGLETREIKNLNRTLKRRTSQINKIYSAAFSVNYDQYIQKENEDMLKKNFLDKQRYKDIANEMKRITKESENNKIKLNNSTMSISSEDSKIIGLENKNKKEDKERSPSK